MVKAYEGKLSEFVIPVEELGFDPLVPTNTDWKYISLNFKKSLDIIFLKNLLF